MSDNRSYRAEKKLTTMEGEEITHNLFLSGSSAVKKLNI